MADPSIKRFRSVVEVALARLEERREEINDLNVYPVRDGDTGDNMAMTMRAVLDELARLERDSDGGDPDRSEIVTAVARAAMMGARGNSGVILSQIVRGAAEELASRPGRLIDPQLVAAALSNAERAAYEALRNPVEGTMLTVAREMARAVTMRLAHWEQHELSPDASDEEQNLLLVEVLGSALAAAQAAVDRTPEQLDVLREAGVVDAGALGLTVIIHGAIAGLLGAEAELPELPHYAPPKALVAHGPDSRYRYCTNFTVLGPGLDRREWETRLCELGDSVLVVGDEGALKVHVHTDDPDAAKALFAGAGRIEGEDIADMHEQIAERDARLGAAGTGLVAVASGAGLRALFEELGAVVVDGALDPSPADLLEAVERTGAAEVVLLPNSKNVTLAAEEAARLAERPVEVVPSTTQQGSLAVLVEFDPARPAAENAKRLSDALGSVRVAGVAQADRDDPRGRFARGESVALANGDAVAWGEPEETLRAAVEKLAAGAEIVTIVEGEGAPFAAAEAGLPLPDGAELEVVHGGQPAWWWLIAAQ